MTPLKSSKVPQVSVFSQRINQQQRKKHYFIPPMLANQKGKPASHKRNYKEEVFRFVQDVLYVVKNVKAMSSFSYIAKQLQICGTYSFVLLA